jgi:AcrR family transcriptional regulator
VSSTEIAREAGVARGLLHHYFGTKRDLYREVVRSMLRFPAVPVEDTETAIDRWLTMVSRNREAFFAAVGFVPPAPGHDPELEAIVEAGREEAVERLIYNLDVPPTRELRAALRAYSAFAEAAAAEWLVRRRLSRRQVAELLLSTLDHVTGGSP